MKKIAAALVLACGLATAGQVQAAGMEVHGMTPGDWAPVPKLQRVTEGPKPGTQCEKRYEIREYVNLVDSHFEVEGVQSSSNHTDVNVPLSQRIKESKSRKWTWTTTVNINLSEEIKKQYKWVYQQEMFWSLGQNIGPYDLYPGEKGTLAWGFIMDDYTSQRVRCGVSGTWEPLGRQQHGSIPRERHVEVSITKM